MGSLLADRETEMPETLPLEKQTNDFVPVILIVEDDEDSRTMLKILLEMWNYRVIEAVNGLEAVLLAEKTRPNLILMDVRLPHLDGLDATQRIRQSSEIGSVPVLILSGCAEAGYRKAASVAGGNEYLVKPLDFEELRNAIGKFID